MKPFNTRHLRCAPWPKRPSTPCPHDHIEPSALRASEWLRPAATSTQRFDDSAVILRGNEAGAQSPTPSWPWRLSPQAHTQSLAQITRVCFEPHDTQMIGSRNSRMEPMGRKCGMSLSVAWCAWVTVLSHVVRCCLQSAANELQGGDAA